MALHIRDTPHSALACDRSHRCGEVGHLGSECTSLSTIPESRKCYGCGKEGHLSSNCPADTKRGMCYNCGGQGHTSRNCPKPVPRKSSKGKAGEADADADMKEVGLDYDGEHAPTVPGANKKCNQCGEKGHMSAACPKAGETKVCFAFLKGKCKRGEECLFKH